MTDAPPSAVDDLQSWRTTRELAQRKEQAAQAALSRAEKRAAAIARAKAAALRSIRSYEELLASLDAQRVARGYTMSEMDIRTGLADGYVAKVLVGMKNLGPASLPCILEALKVDLVLIERRNGE